MKRIAALVVLLSACATEKTIMFEVPWQPNPIKMQCKNTNLAGQMCCLGVDAEGCEAKACLHWPVGNDTIEHRDCDR